MQFKPNMPLLAAVVSGALVFTAPSVDAQDNYRDQRSEQSRNYDQSRNFDQRGEQTQRGSQAQLDRQERKVAETMLDASAGTIELARLAEDRARNEELQQFARTLRQHHRDVQQEVASLSPDLRTGQAQVTELDRWAIDRLNEIESDREFQQAFTELMVARQRMAINGLEMVANDQNVDRELRRLADNELYTIRQHLQTAQRINRDVRQVASGDQD